MIARTHGRPLLRPALLGQPKSALPRNARTAATVSTAALTSPLITPVSSSSTRELAWMLPCTSPLTITVADETWPVTLGAVLDRHIASTFTSPLKRPPDANVTRALDRCLRCDVRGDQRLLRRSAGTVPARDGPYRTRRWTIPSRMRRSMGLTTGSGNRNGHVAARHAGVLSLDLSKAP